MKKNTLFTCITIILMATACKDKTETVYSDCLEEKIEAFKNEESTQRIVKITRPDGNLYWFVGGAIDAGYEMVNEDCELVCITDCECDGNVIIICDSTHLDFPQETIWER
jgi:hypothetical protein